MVDPRTPVLIGAGQLSNRVDKGAAPLEPVDLIAEALRRAGGVKMKAAELLGMSFRSFRYYTKKYNLK